MTNILFITEKYLKNYTAMNAAVDVEELIPHVRTAQDLHVQGALGTKLYNRLRQRIADDTLQSEDTDLLNLIAPALAHYTLYVTLPYIHLKIRNKNIVKAQGEYLQSASLSDVKYLREDAKSTAEFYMQRAKDYINENRALFPEYTCVGNGVNPSKGYDCDLFL
jgi:hypothetical protein